MANIALYKVALYLLLQGLIHNSTFKSKNKSYILKSKWTQFTYFRYKIRLLVCKTCICERSHVVGIFNVSIVKSLSSLFYGDKRQTR